MFSRNIDHEKRHGRFDMGTQVFLTSVVQVMNLFLKDLKGR